uniref:ARID domain-containing protein n=1 Tax=Rhabditophanes sp. KR3021 TaxID=114890 RepID=A0AC35TPT8_9BILA
MSELSESPTVTTTGQGAEEAVVSNSPSTKTSPAQQTILNNKLSTKQHLIDPVPSTSFDTNTTTTAPSSQTNIQTNIQTNMVGGHSDLGERNNVESDAKGTDLGTPISQNLQEQQNLPPSWPLNNMPPPHSFPTNFPPNIPAPNNNQWLQQQPRFLPAQPLPQQPGQHPYYGNHFMGQPLGPPTINTSNNTTTTNNSNGGGTVLQQQKLSNGVSPHHQSTLPHPPNSDWNKLSSSTPTPAPPAPHNLSNNHSISTTEQQSSTPSQPGASPSGNSSVTEDNEDSKQSMMNSPSWSNQSTSQKTAPQTPSEQVASSSSRAGVMTPAELIEKMATTLYFELDERNPQLMAERRAFFERLYKISEANEDVITAIPCVSKIPVDLFRLWKGVVEGGGFDSVVKERGWRNLCILSHPNMVNSAAAGYQLRRHYTKYVLRLECEDTGKNYEESVQKADKLKKKRKDKEPMAKGPPSQGNASKPMTPVPQNIPPLHHQQQQLPPSHQPQVTTPQPQQGSIRPPFAPPHQQGQGFPPQPPHHPEMGPGYQYQQQQVPYNGWPHHAPQQPGFYGPGPNMGPRMGQPQMGGQPQMTGQLPMSQMGGQPMSQMGGQPPMSQIGGQPPMSQMGGQPPMPQMRNPNMPPEHIGYEGMPPNQHGGYYPPPHHMPTIAPQHIPYPGSQPYPHLPGPSPMHQQPQQQSGPPEIKSATPSQVSSRAPSAGPPPPGTPDSSRMSSIAEEQPTPQQLHTPVVTPHQSSASPYYPPPNSGPYNQRGSGAMQMPPQGYPPHMQTPQGMWPPRMGPPPPNSAQQQQFPPMANPNSQQRRPPTGYPPQLAGPAMAPPQPSPQPAPQSQNRSKFPSTPQGMVPPQYAAIHQQLPPNSQQRPPITPQNQHHMGNAITPQQLMPPGQMGSSNQMSCFTVAPSVPIPKMMPQNTIEGITYENCRKRKKMFIKDIQQTYHPKRYIMALRSGLDTETSWAINNLTILLYDPEPNLYLNFEAMPDLLTLSLEHLRATLALLFPEEFKGYKTTSGLREIEDKEVLQTEFDESLNMKPLTNGSASNGGSNSNGIVIKEEATVEAKPIIKVTEIAENKSKELRFVEREMPIELRRIRPVAFNLDSHLYDETMRADTVAVNYSKGLGVGFAERISCQIKNIVSFEEELEEMKALKRRKCENGVVVKVKTEDVVDLNERTSIKDIKLIQTEVDRKKNFGLYTFRHMSAQQLADRCLALSNIIRGFAFLPKNEHAMRKSYSLLNILGKCLKLRCGEKKLNYSNMEDKREAKEEDELMGDMLLEEDDDDNSILDHVADTLRQDAFVILSFICGHLNLMEYDSDIAFTILDGLIHWSTSKSIQARESIISGDSNAKNFALDILGKLVIQEGNVDLIWATGPMNRNIEFVKVLSTYLSLQDDISIRDREFSLVILDCLGNSYQEVSLILGNDTDAVKHLMCFIEVIHNNMQDLTNRHGPQVLRDGSDSMGTSWIMLRRAGNILFNISKVPSNVGLFVKHQYSILELSSSNFISADPKITQMFNNILFEVSQYSRNLYPPPIICHDIVDYDDLSTQPEKETDLPTDEGLTIKTEDLPTNEEGSKSGKGTTPNSVSPNEPSVTTNVTPSSETNSPAIVTASA